MAILAARTSTTKFKDLSSILKYFCPFKRHNRGLPREFTLRALVGVAQRLYTDHHARNDVFSFWAAEVHS